MRPIRTIPLLALLVLAATSVAQGQSYRDDNDADWLDRCRNGNDNRFSDDDRAHACEVRNVPVKLTGRSISIDGQQNGGVHVVGWDGDSVRVTARLQAQDRTDAGAKTLLSRIRVVADGRSVRADGPSMEEYDHAGWAVSFMVFVPRKFDLDLEAHNGGLSVNGVNGKLELRTTNGSVALNDVGGDVNAHTQNGSLNVQLTGSKWDGAGLDAETHNGSVRLSVPERYSARLETGTVNGRINTEIPITVSGNISRQMSFSIGAGGAPVRARTTNGSVSIMRR
jgi:Putative adhesin